MAHDAPPMPKLPDLPQMVTQLWEQIPTGKVATYGSLARALGSNAASRWIGTLAKSHAHPANCKCHRLVRSDGSLGSYITGEPAEKTLKLTADGVSIANQHIDLNQFQFDDFECTSPLTRLAEYQHQVAGLVDCASSLVKVPTEIGGVDVSYTTPNRAVAAYVVVDTAGELVWSHTVSRETNFPYISGFLAFRELPILLELIAEVRDANQLAEVTMVDGSGILHPRRSGVASMLGVAAGLRTIGVTKKILCGKPTEQLLPNNKMVNVAVDDEILGGAMLPTTGSLRPLYFSPGHRMNIDATLLLSRQQCSHYRLPMPIYWADKISRKVANQA